MPEKGNDQEKIGLLIVDDSPENRVYLGKLVSFETDIEVVGEAADGAEAIQMAVEGQPDVILMDVNMPGVDGLAASETISQQLPACQIILMSVEGGVTSGSGTGPAGVKAVLIKPFSVDELVTTIRQVYHQKR